MPKFCLYLQNYFEHFRCCTCSVWRAYEWKTGLVWCIFFLLLTAVKSLYKLLHGWHWTLSPLCCLVQSKTTNNSRSCTGHRTCYTLFSHAVIHCFPYIDFVWLATLHQSDFSPQPVWVLSVQCRLPLWKWKRNIKMMPFPPISCLQRFITVDLTLFSHSIWRCVKLPNTQIKS